MLLYLRRTRKRHSGIEDIRSANTSQNVHLYAPKLFTCALWGHVSNTHSLSSLLSSVCRKSLIVWFKNPKTISDMIWRVYGSVTYMFDTQGCWHHLQTRSTSFILWALTFFFTSLIHHSSNNISILFSPPSWHQIDSQPTCDAYV